MIAEIIVDHPARRVDKIFDYKIPPELEGTVRIGSRVIVPFSGGNNEVEGYCMGVKDTSEAGKLKSIKDMSDMPRAFDEDMRDVIEWMHEKYLTGYLDILHLIVPAGSVVKGTAILSLKELRISSSEVINEIQRLIFENDGEMEMTRLESKFSCNIKPRIRNLIKKGVLEKKYIYGSQVRTLTYKCVSAAATDGEIDAICEKIEKKAPVQAQILRQLKGGREISLADIKNTAGGAYSATAALAKKKYITVFEKKLERNPIDESGIKKTNKNVPTEEQRKAINRINEAINTETPTAFLLHGVTGSGKTEVFLQTIENAIERHKGAIMLVPEISLTPQTVSRFVSRFGDRVALMHSALSPGERFDQWQKVNEGRADIVIGARSAIFAPLKNIGIIIIDEEHSDTYKSEMSPRYETRDVALLRARQAGAPTVFASATPSAVSMYKAFCGEYELLTMKNRYNNNAMPSVSLVDMREELAKGNKTMFSDELRREITENLKRKEQTILFLNRRGFSTFVSCRNCGYVAKCPKCSISLTYHKYENNLKCHYCGYSQDNYRICPECGSKYIRYFGGGTQKVEEEIAKAFPGASVVRMDVDTTGKKQSHEQLLGKFVKEKTDILVGTQMVAKGLDFGNVTLVGVISADTMLNMSDYRSAERTFSVLEQVCGRAGRGEKEGRAVIQTYSPEAEAIAYVKTHDYQSFYEGEILKRKLMWYPPFSEIVTVMFSGVYKNAVSQCAAFFAKFLVNLNCRAQVLGPLPDGIARINNKYRYRIIIKCDNCDSLNDVLRNARDKCLSRDNYKTVTVVIDKNPNMI